MIYTMKQLKFCLFQLLVLLVAGSAQAQTNDTFLSPKSGFNIERVRSYVTMIKHVVWISQNSESDVLKSLKANGYEVVGNRLITSEAPDDSLKSYYTTGRLRSYVAIKGQDVIVCFRGSSGSNLAQTSGNLITDLRVNKVKPNLVDESHRYAKLLARTEVHAGFHAAYHRLRPEILAALRQHRGKNLYVFGHSLGGAQATLCAFDIGLNQPSNFSSRTLLISGSPRVGDANFRNLFESVSPGACRLTVQGDPVARIPSSSRFLHIGDLINIDTNGSVLGARDLHIDIGEGLSRTWAWSSHDYNVYSKAVGGLHYQASAREYFNGKEHYAKSLGDIERGRARSAD